MLVSCDVFEGDPDKLNPNTSIVDKEIHVYSKNTSVIDLSSIIRSNQSVRLEITSLTKKGELTDLGKGLLQYTPDSRTARVTDGFGFALFSGSEILRTDSVVIIVENDSTELPCGVFPIDDHVYNISPDSVVWVNVLGNDILCGIDSADIQLSIYKPMNEFPPHYGNAEVVNNWVVYHPGNGFTGSDKIIYKLETPGGTTTYGFITIEPLDICSVIATPDFYTIQVDTLNANGVLLPVFSNDIFCDPSAVIEDRSITHAPQWGTATIDTLGITFRPGDLPLGQTRMDSISYEICIESQCYRAGVLLELRKN